MELQEHAFDEEALPAEPSPAKTNGKSNGAAHPTTTTRAQQQSTQTKTKFASVHPKEPVRQLSLMKWGLIPHWAKDQSSGASTINARPETVTTKPAFRDPFTYRRCLIPADGFYEWKRTATSKQPYCFEVNDGQLFAFAGLWDGWKDPSGKWLKTCSILTTTPNAVTSTIHDRMPVILDPDSYDLWLDPGVTNAQVISELLKPYDARLMRCYPVSTRINHVVNDDEECSRRVEIAEDQNRLFV